MQRKNKRTHEKIMEIVNQLTVMTSWVMGATVEYKAKHGRDPWRKDEDPDWEPSWNWESTDYRVYNALSEEGGEIITK